MKSDISIIIPCFNRVDLLKETLKSVALAISGLNAEIIIVDDGSEKPIREGIIDFSYLPLKFIEQSNSGLTTSRFNGLTQAEGEFILFLDSDDQIDARKLQVQLAEMRAADADVSYTDVLNASIENNHQISIKEISTTPESKNPADFYINIQPAPHSPVFRRNYLLKNLKTPYIPLSREFDSIGEVWFYYNLAPYDAKIIKINEPLTIVIHHEDSRLTNHWERLGLCALSLMLQFKDLHPKDEPFANETVKLVAQAAMQTFRGLPFNIYRPFQYAFLDLWKSLGGKEDLKAGAKFKMVANIIGTANTAILFKYLTWNDYHKIKTITKEELHLSSNRILNLKN